MQARLGILVALTLWLGAACSPPTLEHEGAAGPGVVGDACEESSDCNLELGCLQEAPDGFCSRECSADDPCPSGSLCIQVEGEFGEVFGCFVACQPDAQDGDSGSCRAGYDCQQVGDSRLNICYF